MTAYGCTICGSTEHSRSNCPMGIFTGLIGRAAS